MRVLMLRPGGVGAVVELADTDATATLRGLLRADRRPVCAARAVGRRSGHVGRRVAWLRGQLESVGVTVANQSLGVERGGEGAAEGNLPANATARTRFPGFRSAAR
jgi:hypothetical protein